MPGRYLLIEFDDEATASLLREQINAATRKGKRFRVVGWFARPGRPCQCSIVGERSADLVKRGGKFGWWVCTRCKRPRLGNHDLQNLITPPELESFAVIDGVDMLAKAPLPNLFMRHAANISLITLPADVARRDHR